MIRLLFTGAGIRCFDLIHGTNQVASAVAAQTGRAAPALPPSVPTLASNAAASAGINPGKGVANLPAPTTAALGKTTSAPATPNAALSNLLNATSKLKKAAEKKPPSRHATPKPGAAGQRGTGALVNAPGSRASFAPVVEQSGSLVHIATESVSLCVSMNS